jgi:outer membrane lipoprotein-sorting protein
MFSAVLVSLAVSLGSVQENEAEKLYRALEAKIAAAKVVKVAGETVTPAKGSIEATLLFAQGNKAKGRIVLSTDKKPVLDCSLFSDGKRMKLSVKPGIDTTKDAPGHLHELLARGGCRMGVMVLLFPFNKDEAVRGPDALMQLPLSDFRLGQNEKVAGREARVIHFRVAGTEGFAQTLWLDAKTLLPLKRSLIQEGVKEGMTEVYREFTLDPHVDASVFELQK